VLLASLAVTTAGCGSEQGRGGAGGPEDPRERLSDLLRRGAQPGELALAEREEIETLVAALLPPTTGALAGHHWRVAYDDLPLGDFLSIDLLRGEGTAAERPVWLHLVWRGELSEADRSRFVKTVGRWPARGVDDHHLFVRAGAIELRVVADSDEFRDAARLRALVESFDLDALARL
jgi:hypothetical protein